MAIGTVYRAFNPADAHLVRSRLEAALRDRLATGNGLSLDEARGWLAAQTGLELPAAEALLGALSGVTVDWSDLFAPVVRPD